MCVDLWVALFYPCFFFRSFIWIERPKSDDMWNETTTCLRSNPFNLPKMYHRQSDHCRHLIKRRATVWCHLSTTLMKTRKAYFWRGQSRYLQLRKDRSILFTPIMNISNQVHLYRARDNNSKHREVITNLQSTGRCLATKIQNWQIATFWLCWCYSMAIMYERNWAEPIFYIIYSSFSCHTAMSSISLSMVEYLFAIWTTSLHLSKNFAKIFNVVFKKRSHLLEQDISQSFLEENAMIYSDKRQIKVWKSRTKCRFHWQNRVRYCSTKR